MPYSLKQRLNRVEEADMKTKKERKSVPQKKRKKRRIGLRIAFFVFLVLVGYQLYTDALHGRFGPQVRLTVSSVVNVIENTLGILGEPQIDTSFFPEDSYLVYDMETEEIIAENNTEGSYAPASITKLITGAVALEILEEWEAVTVTESDLSFVKKGASVARLTPGNYTVEELMEAMLIPSGNDAAYAIAIGAGRKLGADTDDTNVAMENFKLYMHEWLSNHEFDVQITDVSGHAQEDFVHYDDAIKLTTLALKHPLIDKIVQKTSGKIKTDNGKIDLRTTNLFMNPEQGWFNRRVTGVKTGSIDHVYNIILRYDHGDRDYLLIILGAPTETKRDELTNWLLQSMDVS